LNGICTDHVVEVGGRAQAAVEPRRVGRPGTAGGAWFIFHQETLHHGRAHGVDTADDQGVNVVVEGVAERRHKQNCARRACLMVVVNDLREPLVIQHAIHVLGFGLRVGVEVAVVVVADVFLVEPRQAGERALLGILGAHVMVGDQIHAVGVGVHEEDDDVVEDAQRLGVVGAEELVQRLDERLSAQRFVGVQAAVDPDDGLALGGQLGRLGRADIFGLCQTVGNFLIAGQVAVIGRRGDDAHQLRPALFRLADVDHLEAVRLAFQLFPVAHQLLVVRQAVVVAQVEAEVFLRRGDGLGQRGNGLHPRILWLYLPGCWEGTCR
jgi:hypothetical protein